jgi:hypothetical protein
MPGQIRPNKKATKIAYEILKTPKNQQQDKMKKPSQITILEWDKDSQVKY